MSIGVDGNSIARFRYTGQIWTVSMPWGRYNLSCPVEANLVRSDAVWPLRTGSTFSIVAKFRAFIVVEALDVFWNESIELWKGSGGRRRGSRRVANARAEEPVKRSRSFLSFYSFSGT